MDTDDGLIPVRRYSHLSMESSYEIVRAQTCDSGERMYGGVLIEVIFEPLLHSPHRPVLPPRIAERMPSNEVVRSQPRYDGH